MLTVTKTLEGFSCAHRLHTAESHCRFVHGYDRSFDLTIGATEPDEHGWVFDFGGFKDIRRKLEQQFDHTLLLAIDDPLVSLFQDLHDAEAADVRLMVHPGMEGAVSWVIENIGPMIVTQTDGRAHLTAVTARENNRNAVSWSVFDG